MESAITKAFANASALLPDLIARREFAPQVRRSVICHRTKMRLIRRYPVRGEEFVRMESVIAMRGLRGSHVKEVSDIFDIAKVVLYFADTLNV